MTQHITRWQRPKVPASGQKGAICIDVVLLVLASLRIYAPSVTGVIIANQAAMSPAVNVAAIHQIQTTNRFPVPDSRYIQRFDYLKQPADSTDRERSRTVGEATSHYRIREATHSQDYS